jgi:2-polyprenyl-3-methyl-5-hydroxy-6-metoxy-1,4-benzoquinol methylase
MKDFHENYYSGLKGTYFNRIIRKIISIASLDKRKIRILDFGCGVGKLKKVLGNKVINYDVLEDLSEIKDWKKAKFDVIVANEVFYLFTHDELRKFISDLYKINPDAELIVGISRQEIINKILAFLAGQRDAHDNTKLKHDDEIRILRERMKILRIKSVFFMCDILMLKFKN